MKSKKTVAVILACLFTLAVAIPSSLYFAIEEGKGPKVVMLTKDVDGKKYIEETDWYGRRHIEVPNNAEKIRVTDSGLISVYDKDLKHIESYTAGDHRELEGSAVIPFEKKTIKLNIPTDEQGNQQLENASIASACRYSKISGYGSKLNSKNYVIDADIQLDC